MRNHVYLPPLFLIPEHLIRPRAYLFTLPLHELMK